MKTLWLTCLALLAFAGNSILCRLALGDGAIDAASFTSLRLVSGIITLMLILNLTSVRSKKSSGGDELVSKGRWFSAVMLFIYAAGFSYAYLTLDTGTGALILFAAVQITIIVMGIIQGNKLTPIECTGVVTAFSGFVYLVFPGVSAPSMSGLLLMSLSGIAWGFYTLAGKSSKQPLYDTAYNFLRTLPLVLGLIVISWSLSLSNAVSVDVVFSIKGVVLAVLSGALASGVGYTIWYMALSGLTTTQSASVQLLVPVIASIGGVFFANESLNLRLIIASLLILGGILLVILAKRSTRPV